MGNMCHATTDWFKIGEGVHQGCIMSPCLFNLYAEYIMQNSRLKSRLLGEISTTSDMQMIPLMAEREEELKSQKRRVKKLAWNSTLKKLRSWHPVPSLHGKQKGKKWKQWQIFFSWAPKSLKMVTTTKKLKAMTNLESVLKGRDITLPRQVHIVKAMVFPVIMYRCNSTAIFSDVSLGTWNI